jgi:glycosyltransferase involved in cell wall biosynthesis
VVDQIDPGRVEEEIVQAETAKWPSWQALPGGIPDAYFHRLEQEWHLATRVVVNSDWSRNALIRQGVPPEKLAVIPLCYEPSMDRCPRRDVGSEAAVTVLWLGLVILRKGIQYLMEAARVLRHQRVRFIVAGPIGISPEAVASAPDNMQFLGPISRSHVPDMYDSADIFVLPTLSDGFAITQIEAMAHGLPVITTPNCGKVVTDGEDGRIVPAADAPALAAAIEGMASNRAALLKMSHNAIRTVQRFSVEESTERLRHLLVDIEGSR